jgi:hypothetical protein
MELRILTGSKEEAVAVSTSAGDGRLCFWDINPLPTVKNLRI